MILDSSAIVAVVLREPGYEGIVSKLATAAGDDFPKTDLPLA